MKKLLSYIALVIGLLFISCAQDVTSTFGGISGVVKDKITAEALAGVQVSIMPGDESSVTGTDGIFQFSDLDAADYTVSFMKEGYVSDSKKVTVSPGVKRYASITLEPIVPVLSVTPAKLEFGSETTTLALDITNTGKGSLQWSVSEEIDWLSCQPDKGTTTNESSSVVFKVSRDRLERGHYSETIVISSNGGSLTIPVTVSVESINIAVEPDELDFGTLTSSLQLTLKNTGSGTKSYKVESSKSWLALSKTSGAITETDYITAIVAREGLSAGKYDATITISTDGGNIVIPVKMEVAVEAKPTVTVETATNIAYNSALLHGTMVSVGSSKVTRYGFCWSEQPNPTIENVYCTLRDNSEPTAFESTISNLKSETKYYFRSYAENSVGIAYSEKEQSFTTTGLPTLPNVTSVSIEEITSATAVAKGNITSLGNVAKITHYGHVWSKSAQPTLENGKYNDLGESDSPQAYTSEICDLEAHTVYHIRAYATNEKGTAYGEDLTFTTANTDVKITTAEVTDITHNAATSGGTISDDGGHTITERGVCWSSDKELPTVSDNHTSTTADAASTLTAYGLSKRNAARSEYVTRASDSYLCRINGLSKTTKYNVRAYVKTSSGNIFYGDVKQFTTTEEILLPSLVNVTVSNIQTTSATFISKIESNGNGTITECGFCYSTQPKPSVENGTKVICDPASSELGKNVTGLTDNTQYYVRAYARNAAGIAYSEEVSFTTLAITPPVLSHVTAENIGRTTAYVSATITDTGNASVTECGFCWATSPYPTVYDNKVSCEVGTSFKTKLQNLPLLTTVYVRAYAVNSKGTGYSDGVSFTTTDSDIDIWDGVSVATKFGGGMGTESDPIIINSADQLKLLADNVNSGKSTYNGIYLRLDVNIGLANHPWTAIGSVNHKFCGIFDGNSKTIDGLSINSSTALYQGLFGYNSGTIRNLIVKGSVVAGDYLGGLCGYNSGTIDGCTSEVTVTGSSNCIGGLCGHNSYKIQSSINRGKVSGKDAVGGIAGSNDGKIESCENRGDVQANDKAGGICGMANLIAAGKAIDVTPIYDCQNFGNIQTNQNAGGILGYANIRVHENSSSAVDYCYSSSCRIKNCNNCGTAIGGTQGGGIVGYVFLFSCRYYSSKIATAEIHVENCCNNGRDFQYGLIGSIERTTSTYNYYYTDASIVDISHSYWLYDIVNNIGNEFGYSGNMSSWYNRNAAGCYLKSSNEDIVTLLNNWVSTNSGTITYKCWRYETINEYACPVLE